MLFPAPYMVRISKSRDLMISNDYSVISESLGYTYDDEKLKSVLANFLIADRS